MSLYRPNCAHWWPCSMMRYESSHAHLSLTLEFFLRHSLNAADQTHSEHVSSLDFCCIWGGGAHSGVESVLPAVHLPSHPQPTRRSCPTALSALHTRFTANNADAIKDASGWLSRHFRHTSNQVKILSSRPKIRRVFLWCDCCVCSCWNPIIGHDIGNHTCFNGGFHYT